MDYNRTLEIILSSLLGGGGLAALLTALRARRSKTRGVSGNEKVATSQLPAQPIPLGTPDWEALTRYWQNELVALRKEFAEHMKACARQAREDANYIDALEGHIWLRKPPPPPRRRTGKEKDDDETGTGPRDPN